MIPFFFASKLSCRQENQTAIPKRMIVRLPKKPPIETDSTRIMLSLKSQNNRRGGLSNVLMFLFPTSMKFFLYDLRPTSYDNLISKSISRILGMKNVTSATPPHIIIGFGEHEKYVCKTP